MNQEVGAVEGGRDWVTMSLDITGQPSSSLTSRIPTVAGFKGCPVMSSNSLGGAIIPSFLDDYGLDPYEMRVYIRLARRAGMGGQCWESISKMAHACRMSDRKLKDCLALLIGANLIKQLKRSGFTDVYELLPESHWVPPVQLDLLRTNLTASRRRSNNKRQNTPEPEMANQGKYVAPGYVAPGYVAPGYVTPTPQVLNTSVGRYSLPTPQVPDTYKGIPLRNPLEDIPQDIPNTPLTPHEEKTGECVEPETLNNSVPGINQCCSTSVLDKLDDSQAKTVSVEVVGSAAPRSALEKHSAAGKDLLDEKLKMLLERYNRGEIGKLPEAELKMLAAAVIGDTVKLYRGSGKVLSSAPNDIDRQLMQFIAVRDKQDFVYGTRLIAAMERTPSRWGELVELVAAWQLGDVNAIPNAAKQIALHTRLQQSKQSTFEAIKDL